MGMPHANAGYFDAPATREAPLGGAGTQGLKAELPLVTLVFSAVDGLKAMRVRKHAPCCAVLCCAVLCCSILSFPVTVFHIQGWK